LVALSNRNLASAIPDADDFIKIWSPKEDSILRRIKSGCVKCLLALSNDQIAAGSKHRIFIWNSCTSEQIKVLTTGGQAKTIESLMLLNDVTEMASSSSDSTIHIWNLERGQVVRTLECHYPICNLFLYSNDILVGQIRDNSYSDGTRLQFWNVQTGRCVRNMDIADSVICSAVLKQSNYLLTEFWPSEFVEKNVYTIGLWSVKI
jgi:WD40 repeat protein